MTASRAHRAGQQVKAAADATLGLLAVGMLRAIRATSRTGIAWTAATALVMVALAAGKTRTGRALDNPVLTAEGRVTVIDGLLAGAVLLGGITVGDHARIGANAVVLTDVPAGKTAVGVPARIV